MPTKVTISKGMLPRGVISMYRMPYFDVNLQRLSVIAGARLANVNRAY